MRYAYFLGCITPYRCPGIEKATRNILKMFGIEVLDIRGASCCPAPGVFGSFDLLTWIAVAARNIAIAEDMNADIVVTCNGCYATLSDAIYLLNNNKNLKKKVNDILKTIDREYRGTAKVKHIVDVLNVDVGYQNIGKMVKHPLGGIKVAVHYGCHFLKPSRLRKHGSSEHPILLDKLVEVVGAKNVNYQRKQMCCGAGGGVRSGNLDLAQSYTKKKIESMVNAKADCVVTPCAFCHFQFDTGQIELNRRIGYKYKLPVVFITQLLGLAFGMSLDNVGLHINQTSVESLKNKI